MFDAVTSSAAAPQAPVSGSWPADPNAVARRLFSGLPRQYDALAELLSFGQNRRWRTEMVRHVAVPPRGLVLDVATGTAGVAIRLAERTDVRVVGADLTESMLRQGAVSIVRHGLDDRIHLVAGRAEELPFADERFDALTFTYLLRYVADPPATLREMVRVVRPGGTIASLEFMLPSRRVWRAPWRVYTRFILPVAGRPFGREWYDVGRFLGPSISDFYRRWPLGSIVAAWHEAGLVDVGVRTMSVGGGVVMWGRRRDD